MFYIAEEGPLRLEKYRIKRDNDRRKAESSVIGFLCFAMIFLFIGALWLEFGPPNFG